YGGTINVATSSTIGVASGSILNLISAVTANAVTLTLGGAGTINVSGAIGGTGASSLVVDGVTAVLSADNTYNGTTTIQNGGVLQIGNNTATGTFGAG